ncbi:MULTISPECIES: YciI family protein [unclassified Novosphingobium]|uniref:YciI family protein n=1 Tax=unclassified Novosphingobium TaxID=2644732 RepID=UPI001356ECA9|nr:MULTISPECIES: YciI family protein [unclassified Novosphingobium]
MIFLIEANDLEGMLERRLALRDSHLAYWRSFGDRVAAGGALMSGDGQDALPIGSMLLVEAESMGEARSMLAADPFTLEGVFSGDVGVRRWRPGIGRWCEP